jgi:hypothetical protein
VTTPAPAAALANPVLGATPQKTASAATTEGFKIEFDKKGWRH